MSEIDELKEQLAIARKSVEQWKADALRYHENAEYWMESAERWRAKAMQLEAELQGKQRREKVDTEITEILDRVSREVVAAWEQEVEKAVAQAKLELEELLIKQMRDVFEV